MLKNYVEGGRPSTSSYKTDQKLVLLIPYKQRPGRALHNTTTQKICIFCDFVL